MNYSATELARFATDLFTSRGMEADKARTMGALLVEADMLGHTTHGLAMADHYLDEIAGGVMARSGGPTVLSDRGACVSWDGRRLPGLWLVQQAVDLALERVQQYGTVSIAIGNSHHVACLAAYLRQVTEQGLAITIASSGPGVATVVPFGGISPALSPAPVAAGFPTEEGPILIDVSASITTNNMAARLAREGRHFAHPWLVDKEGTPSGNPAVLRDGGSLLPVGGMDHGQKGYGWALIAEALSQGLSGLGRADRTHGTINAVLVQVFDPAAFAGREAFVRQTQAIADGCRQARPADGQDAVRVPGQAALAKRAAALRDGVVLHPGVFDALADRAHALGVALPAAARAA